MGDKPPPPQTNGWKLWRRGSSQERPLRPSSSLQGSENSYSEEPCVSDDPSALYAELNSSSSMGVAYSLSTYSEIPEGGALRSGLSTYENAGYVLSEAGSPLGRHDSSAGSTSTPSSAYYSDVSLHADLSKKKKKRR